MSTHKLSWRESKKRSYSAVFAACYGYFDDDILIDKLCRNWPDCTWEPLDLGLHYLFAFAYLCA